MWISVKQSGEVLCAHCTCMAGAGEACSHITSILFTLDMNTRMKQQFSCTSLPCSSTFRSSPFSEIAKINFQLQSINANKLQDMENHLLKTKNFCPQVYWFRSSCISWQNISRASWAVIDGRLQWFFNKTVSFTFNQAVMVEERTRGQINCRAWFEQRAGRITASKLCTLITFSHLFPWSRIFAIQSSVSLLLLHTSMVVSMKT